MILQIYTIIHTLISLVAIFTGFVVVFGLLGVSVSMAGRNGFSSQPSRRRSVAYTLREA